MLFNPLRQIADKFNEMQLGMIAAAFAYYWTADQIQIQEQLKHTHFP
jgi:hypothetical protein